MNTLNKFIIALSYLFVSLSASAQETPGGKIFVHVFLGDGKVPEDIRKKDASWEKDQGIMWKKYRSMDALVRKILETEYVEEMMENDGLLY